jgi:hypothetical protein
MYPLERKERSEGEDRKDNRNEAGGKDGGIGEDESSPIDRQEKEGERKQRSKEEDVCNREVEEVSLKVKKGSEERVITSDKREGIGSEGASGEVDNKKGKVGKVDSGRKGEGDSEDIIAEFHNSVGEKPKTAKKGKNGGEKRGKEDDINTKKDVEADEKFPELPSDEDTEGAKKEEDREREFFPDEEVAGVEADDVSNDNGGKKEKENRNLDREVLSGDQYLEGEPQKR